MIGYLSGPITGHKDYRRQFAKAAAALKAKKAELKDAQKQLAKIEKQEAALAEQAAQNQRKADAEKLATAFLESGKSLDEVLRALQ